jgi:hypothetical protein
MRGHFMQLIKEMQIEHELVENQLNTISRLIFSINDNTNLLEHEVMYLGLLIENLGLSIEELNANYNNTNNSQIQNN